VLKPFLSRVVGGQDLTTDEAHQAMAIIMDGKAGDVQIAGFLVALRAKGERADELIGFARVMRDRVLRLPHDEQELIDTCGTGGDGMGTLNVSTAAALVAAAGGARVAKHGNRSVSSRCGSADILERWGVRIDLTPESAALCLASHGITFLFAPRYHPAMKHAAGPRREMGIRTVFNLLGPMTNPAGVRRQVLGVFDRRWTEPLAQTLQALGSQHVLVVASHDGLDEISPAAPTQITELQQNEIRTYQVEPSEFDLNPQDLRSIAGGDADANAARLGAVLRGEADDAVTAIALNAGAALYVSGRSETLADGVIAARDILATDDAWQKLSAWANQTQELAS